jgi:uncharacterized membrane protein
VPLAGVITAFESKALGVRQLDKLVRAFDRNVGATAAALTSVKAVLRNPMTMALWGVIVACALVIGSLPFLLGLAIVMPVLGHATWHCIARSSSRT